MSVPYTAYGSIIWNEIDSYLPLVLTLGADRRSTASIAFVQSLSDRLQTETPCSNLPLNLTTNLVSRTRLSLAIATWGKKRPDA